MRRTMMGMGALFLLCAAWPAAANVTVTVDCTAGGVSASEVFFIQCTDNTVNWALAGPYDISVDGVRLGRIKELSFEADNEPYVNLHFSVEADAVDTTFDVKSAVISFDSLINPQVYASAGVTLTSDANGAQITGLFGGACYQARYNGDIAYANLVTGFSTSGNQTDTHSARRPDGGYEGLTTPISSIQSEFHFTSALDQASGTSRFEVIPEPATVSLLALYGLALLRRRR
jgi:hypothetical protein